MWSHKPHTKTNKRKNINSNNPHRTMNKLIISHIGIYQDLNYYQLNNKRKINQDGNQQINNIPVWKKKQEG